MKWHVGILAGAALALASCGAANFQDRAVGILLNEPVDTNPQARFPRFTPLLQAKQGPALDVRIASTGLRGGFLLESKRGNIESWLGTDGVALIFDRGVLQGTRGLGAGMLASDVSASASAILSGRSGSVERVHTFLTGNDIAQKRGFTCAIENQGFETITLDIGPTNTRRMSESCRNARNESFQNTYWVDTRRGTIVKSQQWSGDFIGALNIQTVYNF